jgi:hypothetical protein
MGGAPAGYDAAGYGRDFKLFRAFVKQALPDMLIAGPGSVGETTRGGGLAERQGGPLRILKTADLVAASGPGVDVFSYHHYGAVSQRCASMGPQMQTTPDQALSEQWLRRTDETLGAYRMLRDEFEPGKPIWLTETAEAACGGNPWANTFLDSFRYLDQLGRLARQGVQTVMHNTLAASDYSLLDETNDFAPKPNYWAALLWRRLMGTTVLDPGVPAQEGLHLYAHCLRGAPGGVALLAINTDSARPRTLAIPLAGERYTLSSPSSDLQDKRVQLNGTTLALGGNNELPPLAGAPTAAGTLALAPATITFVALPNAGSSACR